MSKIADETIRSQVEIDADKITVTDSDDEASLYFDTDRMPPLKLDNTHVTLRVKGEDFTAAVELDGYDIDALADELHDYQEKLRDHK